jgi:hypothetical protein
VRIARPVLNRVGVLVVSYAAERIAHDTKAGDCCTAGFREGLCQHRVRLGHGGMSALSPFYPQLRTLVGDGWYGSFVPKAVVSRCSNVHERQYHLVGAREHGWRDFEAERRWLTR